MISSNGKPYNTEQQRYLDWAVTIHRLQEGYQAHATMVTHQCHGYLLYTWHFLWSAFQ